MKTLSSAEKIICGTCKKYHRSSADNTNQSGGFLQKRKNDSPEESYTARLISKGINKIAQKVGEEAVELVIEAKDDNEDLFLNEAADLMYHYLVLLIAKGYGLEDVIRVLKERHK